MELLLRVAPLAAVPVELIGLLAGIEGEEDRTATQCEPGDPDVTRNSTNGVFACNRDSTTFSGVPVPEPTPASPHAGIRTRSMSASFDWLMIVETQ